MTPFPSPGPHRLRRRVAAAAVALAAALSLASVASAAPRSGSVSDPRDVLPSVQNPGLSGMDVRSVATTYEPETGELTVVLTLHDPLPWGASTDLGLGLGAAGADGRCSAPTTNPNTGAAVGRTGDPVLDLSVYTDYQRGWTDFQAYGYMRVAGYSGAVGVSSGTQSADRRGVTWTFGPVPALVRRDLTCVTSIVMGRWTDNPDEASPFFFSGFAPPPPATDDVTAPVVSWQSPRQGQTISGIWQEAGGNGRSACRIGATDDVGVTRVDVFLDGDFLNQELYAPWACVLDTTAIANGTHTLRAVAYDARGNSRASSIQVVVDNPEGAPPPPPLPVPPPPPTPPALAPIVSTSPPVVVTPPPVVPAVAPADVTAPGVGLGTTGRSIRTLRLVGLVARFTCTENCLVTARLLLPAATAARLGLPRLIGSTGPAVGTPATRAVTIVRLTPRARRALAGRRSLAARLELTGTDASGNVRVIARTVTFGR